MILSRLCLPVCLPDKLLSILSCLVSACLSSVRCFHQKPKPSRRNSIERVPPLVSPPPHARTSQACGRRCSVVSTTRTDPVARASCSRAASRSCPSMARRARSRGRWASRRQARAAEQPVSRATFRAWRRWWRRSRRAISWRLSAICMAVRWAPSPPRTVTLRSGSSSPLYPSPVRHRSPSGWQTTARDSRCAGLGT